MGKTYCERHRCPWLSGERCTSPNDPCGNECDYDWAMKCQKCGAIIAVGDDDDGYCPYCGSEVNYDS